MEKLCKITNHSKEFLKKILRIFISKDHFLKSFLFYHGPSVHSTNFAYNTLLAALWMIYKDIKLVLGTLVNPISAGVVENQDMLGGGVNLTPPPLNPMFDVQI